MTMKTPRTQTCTTAMDLRQPLQHVRWHSDPSDDAKPKHRHGRSNKQTQQPQRAHQSMSQMPRRYHRCTRYQRSTS